MIPLALSGSHIEPIAYVLIVDFLLRGGLSI